MTTFIDTNILIYLLDEKAKFHSWSIEQFSRSRLRGPIVISDLVYCEFSVGMSSLDEVDKVISELALERINSSDTALFRAGRAFLEYKKNKGEFKRVLPDFIIGAVAALAGAPLITANAGDFASYFPEVEIICPS